MDKEDNSFDKNNGNPQTLWSPPPSRQLAFCLYRFKLCYWQSACGKTKMLNSIYHQIRIQDEKLQVRS
jgi:hypothetical protein